MAKGGPSALSKLLGGLSFGGGGGGTAVGLNIGTSSIKVVELKKARKVWKLLHFGIVQLPEDAIVGHEIINRVAVVDALKTLINQVKLKSKTCCISLTGSTVILKRMTVEFENAKELEDQIFWEAEQYLPFDPSEVVMDYHMISKSKDKRADVMLVAAKTSQLDAYMDSVTQAGLKPKIVDVDFFALQNVFEANYPTGASEAVLIADVGAANTNVLVVQDRVPVFTKDVGIGGATLTHEIQRTLGVSYTDAEALKVGGKAGGTPQEINELLGVMAENVAKELQKTIDLYMASSSGNRPQYVLLAGGGSRIPGLSAHVEDTLKLPVQILNPFNAVSYDPAVFTQDYIQAIAPIAAVPVGLALRAGEK
jgi:type IV pilus assembly protein PilM